MPLALGLALVLAIVWTDSCKRHLWESLGPLHHFNCDCRGFRYYRRHDTIGNIFSFSVAPPEDLLSADRGTLDMTVVEVAGPKSSSSFLAVQLGEVVHCSDALAAVNRDGGRGVYQELRIPVPSRLPRSVHIFLYGHNRPNSERLLAIAKVPLELNRMFGLHDITVPFLNYDGVPAGHVRLVMRMGAPGSASLSTIDLVPYMAEASDMADDCCRPQPEDEDDAQGTSRAGGPIVVFSAGGKPSIAVPLLENGKAEDEDEKEGGESDPVAAGSSSSPPSASSRPAEEEKPLLNTPEEPKESATGGSEVIATSSTAALALAMPAVVSSPAPASGPSIAQINGAEGKLATGTGS